MKVQSTRQQQAPIELHQAIAQGLAKDGGLFVPVAFPQANMNDFTGKETYPQFAAKVLGYFFQDDEFGADIATLCDLAFDFPVPLVPLNANTYILELFHGPTCSFKDFGARFLANFMELVAKGDEKTTILVATSGDTGSAVAAAFHAKPHAKVIVLFPEGKISARQQQQIVCWGDNVQAFSVQGTFDDCQRMVKAAYVLQDTCKLSTANSINLGRLLPQTVYYAYTAWHFQREHGEAPGFVVPSGNVGNVTACFWAKKLGFPVGEVAIATNSNQVLKDFLATGDFVPRQSVATLANAMDVGNPSNFERLRELFPDFEEFKCNLSVMSVTDMEIEATIKNVYQASGRIVCPHTATACYMRERLSDKPWIVVATADAAKFETIVEPLLKVEVPVPTALQNLLDMPSYCEALAAEDVALQRIIEGKD
jgi:threonine synthase